MTFVNEKVISNPLLILCNTSLMNTTNPETVIVKKSKHGQGIFTSVNLSKDDIILKIKGAPLSFGQTLDLGPDECYCLQVGMDKYIVPDFPFYLSNHSCDPNCGINHKMELFALKEIKAGEELCWDYSTSMMERHWTMACNCGSPMCRHNITDFDLLPLEVKDKYLHMGILMPFIKEFLYGPPKISRAERKKRII